MKIAVLGSGNGGCAVAFDWAQAGHEVALFDFEQFNTQIQAIASAGGIYAQGQLEGFAPVKYAGHDIEPVVADAELIFAVGPAYSTRPFGEACRGLLREGQTVVVCPGSCGGALVMKTALGMNVESDRIIVAETSTLPYAVRLIEPGKINVFLRLKAGVFLAACPSRHTTAVLDRVQQVFPFISPAKNILQTTLQNGNPIIHPPISLLNAGLIERTAGDFCFYEDGVTPAVGRMIEALDLERIALAYRLDIDLLSDPVLGMQQGYMQEATYDNGYSQAEGFRGIKAQSSLDYRYFHEDVGYGLVFMTDLGKQIDVPTPNMDAVITIVSSIMQQDYRKEARRTMAGLGLADYTLEDLKAVL